MARPKHLAPFTIAVRILLLTCGVNSTSAPSCTDDCAPFIPGTVAYWPLTLEAKGSDMSGHGNNVTFLNLTYTDGPNGEPNGAVHFHGNKYSYALITNSPSMDLGKYKGFSICGFVRYLSLDMVALIDWSDDIHGLHVWTYPAPVLYLNLQTDARWVFFPSNLKFTKGKWQFFGVSYEKATGIVTGFVDGLKEQIQIKKDRVATTASTGKHLSLGVRLNEIHNRKAYNGDMSCMMVFKFALTADDFERVKRFCRATRTSTQTTLPNIAVSDITTTTATASWTKSPGIFSGYNITIERSGKALGEEIVYPRSLNSSVRLPRVTMVNLIPGATYRVHVWHIMEAIKGRARSSLWFETMLFPPKPGSIMFSSITATSAKVTWDEATGNFDVYSVDIRPTTGGAKVVPNTVPRGTTTTSLKNLSPGSYYTITIRSQIGSTLSSQPMIMKSFQTPVLFPPKPGSIMFSSITATSAKVTWDEATGNFDVYSVDIRPTTGGAKVVPNTVPRGTTTTSLKNLSPGSYYTITIRSQIGSTLSSQSMIMNSFQTPAATDPPKSDAPKPDAPEPEYPRDPIAFIGLVVAGICLVVIIALIALIVILFRRIGSLSSSNGDAKGLPMSNLGFQSDDQSTSNTKNKGEYDGYEVPDRRQYEGNSGSRQVPPATTADNVYENLND